MGLSSQHACFVTKNAALYIMAVVWTEYLKLEAPSEMCGSSYYERQIIFQDGERTIDKKRVYRMKIYVHNTEIKEYLYV